MLEMLSEVDWLLWGEFSHGPDLRFSLNFIYPWPVHSDLALFNASGASPSSSWKRQGPNFHDPCIISYCWSTANHFVNNCFLLCVFQETKLLDMLVLQQRIHKIWIDVHQFYYPNLSPIREHLVSIVFGGKVWFVGTSY